jgi:hypothetical protein
MAWVLVVAFPLLLPAFPPAVFSPGFRPSFHALFAHFPRRLGALDGFLAHLDLGRYRTLLDTALFRFRRPFPAHLLGRAKFRRALGLSPLSVAFLLPLPQGWGGFRGSGRFLADAGFARALFPFPAHVLRRAG